MGPGVDVVNAYVLIDDGGVVAGMVRKRFPEAYCFLPVDGAVTVETRWGPIGVAICADNHRIETFERVRAAGVRLHVMPHAWPMPVGSGRLVSEADLDVPATRARDLCRAYAAHLGVPTVLVNTVGPMPQMDGLLGRLMSPERFALGGLTQISTPEGERFGPLGTGEDVLVAQVELGPRGDRSGLPRTYDGWLHPGVPLLRRVLMPADAWWGRRTYRRRRAA
jgi:N-carbamoylputrescine amidase